MMEEPFQTDCLRNLLTSTMYMKGLVTIMEFHKVKEKIFSELKKVKM